MTAVGEEGVSGVGFQERAVFCLLYPETTSPLREEPDTLVDTEQ